MNFKEYYNLVEMLVIGQPLDGSYVIAFDKWIWILKNETGQEAILKDIEDKLNIDPIDATKTGYKRFKHVEAGKDSDVYEFITAVQETVSDVLAGQISGKVLDLYGVGSYNLDPKSSVLVAKVVKQLKLTSARYIEDSESNQTKIMKRKMTKQIPDIAYHGTASKYLNKILSVGLRPNEADSNYAKQGIYHEELIFFATRFGEAQHHSVTTAINTKSIPVILELQIPDKNLIIADYDIEKQTGNDSFYTGVGQKSPSHSQTYKKDPMKASKEFGIYGYKGNIKPVFIKYVYVAIKPAEDIYSITDYKKMKPSSALRYIERMEEYGY